jgi:hypothetical protein
MLTTDRHSPFERLQLRLGDRLAALLCSALTGDKACRHSWQATVGAPRSASTGASADASEAGDPSPRSRGGRIVVLHPEYPTAVSLEMGRDRKQRKVLPLRASETRARKAAVNGRPQHDGTADQIELACECDDEACPARIVLSPDEYAFLRTVPGYYAVSPGHVNPEDHIIVGDADRFLIVE